MVAVDQDPLMLPPVIEVKVVGLMMVRATNGPVVSVVAVTSWKPPCPIEYSMA
jgi:hypothetical protein